MDNSNIIPEKFRNNFDAIKLINSKLKKNEKLKIKRPILLFNSINQDKCEIDISSLFNCYLSFYPTEEQQDLMAYFGSLAGPFESINDKQEFYTILLNLKVCEDKKNKKNIDLFFQFLIELDILCEIFQSKLLPFRKMKIYKFESPDFLIELEDNKIIGIEVTLTTIERSLRFEKNFVKVQNFLLDAKRKNEPLIYVGQCSGYEPISDKPIVINSKKQQMSNLEIIKNHFDKLEQYKKNIRKIFPEHQQQIFYVFDLGGIARRIENEKQKLLKIIKLAQKRNINCKNIIISIGSTEQLGHWFFLEKIKKLLKNLDCIV